MSVADGLPPFFYVGFNFGIIQIYSGRAKVIAEGTTLQGPRQSDQLYSAKILQVAGRRPVPRR